MLDDDESVVNSRTNVVAVDFGQTGTESTPKAGRYDSLRLLKMDEVAGLLNITTARAYALCRLRILPGVVSLGRQKRVSRAALEQFIAAGGRELSRE